MENAVIDSVTVLHLGMNTHLTLKVTAATVKVWQYWVMDITMKIVDYFICKITNARQWGMKEVENV